MNYSLREVQEIIGELLQYSCLDEAFADMGTEYINGKAHYSDVGDKCRQTLQAFVSDTSIK